MLIIDRRKKGRRDTHLDDTFVGDVLRLGRDDGRWRSYVDVGESHQFGESVNVCTAVVTSGRLRVDEDAYVRARRDDTIRLLVGPEDCRRRIAVDVALQYFRRAVVRFHGERRMTKLRSV